MLTFCNQSNRTREAMNHVKGVDTLESNICFQSPFLPQAKGTLTNLLAIGDIEDMYNTIRRSHPDVSLARTQIQPRHG